MTVPFQKLTVFWVVKSSTYCNAKAGYRYHYKRPKNLINSVDIISYFLKIHFNNIVPSKRSSSKIHCFTVHFNSLNFIHQLMYFYIPYNKILV